MKKQHYVFRTLITIILTAIITCTITTLTIYGKKDKNKTTEQAISQAMKSDALDMKLKLIRDKITDTYLGDIDENNLMEYSIKGYVAGLNDIYSAYFTPKEMSEYSDETNGKYVGIGISMIRDKKADKVKIYSVMENSPAEEVGLKEDDYIIKVEDKNITADEFENISDYIKGEEGTKVKIVILRDSKELTFEIERRTVKVINVIGELVSDNIGYIRIKAFEGGVAKQFKDKYQELVNEGAKSLIIDLRDNGGGLVDEAIEIADLFTNKDEPLLIQADKNGNEEITKSKIDKQINMKVSLLVNNESASASEILTGILKEKNGDNTKIIGEKTYGKGVIQSLFQLSDGSGLKITTNEYFTPNHNKINKVGIEPDIKIENDENFILKESIEKDKDKQLQKAIEVLQ